MSYTTTAQTYETDLATATALLADRLAASIGENEYLAEQATAIAQRDALCNEWNDGITIEEWAERAARRLGI